MEPWAGNATLADIAEFLRGKRRIVVTTHMKPDGDAAGSTLALVRALNTPGPWVAPGRAEAWYCGPVPPWLADVAGDTPHRVVAPGAAPEVEGLDAVVVLDTGSWSQLEPVAEWLRSRREMAVLVDHHVQGDAAVAARRHIDTGAAAVCQPVAELCRLILGKAGLSELPPRVAEALFLGIATDTGWFRHSNTTRPVMDTAGALLDAGADNVRLYQVVEQRESPGRLRLLARALASLEVLDAGRLAVMTLTRRDFQETGAQPGESGGFVDFGQSISGVLVTALITEADPGEVGGKGPLTKLSLRSKVGVDVNAVMKAMGGGGHVQAAGARVPWDLERAKREVIALVERQLRV